MLIEGMVFGVNNVFGTTFDWKLSVTLAVGIAFLCFFAVLRLDDQRSAAAFNVKPAEFQKTTKREKCLIVDFMHWTPPEELDK